MNRLSFCSIGAVLAVAGAMFAQNSGVTRTPVYKGDVSVAGREAIIARVEIAPGSEAGRHTHPGDEISYITEGEGELIVEGLPTRHIKAGDGLVVPAGKIHNARNTGSGPLKLIGVYYVEKGQPLATPAK
jgi:quercetin dioxygenase-like cupin family protein